MANIDTIRLTNSNNYLQSTKLLTVRNLDSRDIYSNESISWTYPMMNIYRKLSIIRSKFARHHLYRWLALVWSSSQFVSTI